MLSLLLALAAAAPAPRPGELKTFRDWIVGCDNGRACHATSLMPEDGDWEAERAMLSVERGAEADAAPALSVGTDDPAARLLIDGKPLDVRLVKGGDGVKVRAEDVRRALAALGAGKTLEVKAGKDHLGGAVSLAGLNAALLYMDDEQQRVGTVTALIRPGARPGSAVPPPPALPQVVEARPGRTSAAPAARSRIAALRKASECDEEIKLSEEGAVEAHRVDERTTVTLVLCWRAAYNSSSLVLVSTKPDGSDARPALFDYAAGSGEKAGPDVPPDGAYWDEEAGRLASYSKGRGFGDCGTQQSWAWDGSRFRLIRETAMGECRGSTDWITTWRANTVKR